MGSAQKAQMAQADLTQERKPAEITADEVTHDQDLNMVTARGTVEVTYDDTLLNADALTYNMVEDTITATGNVVLVQPSGEVTFAEYFKLDGELKNGVASNIRMLLSDRRTRIEALDMKRTEGRFTTMKDAAYTPCKQCKENPEAAPLWQVKALTVIHDEKARRIEYKDAWMEFMGVPFLYAPYLTHPDPSVKRESGLLAPTWRSNNDLGFSLETPYFWVIDDHQDVTLKPLFTTDERVALGVEHRRYFENGSTTTDASITVDSQDDTRGHFFFEGDMEFDETWRGELEIARSSDDTYLRKYDISDEAFLTTSGLIEGFSRRSYASARFYSFQGHRSEDDPGETPLILPLLDYNYASQPTRDGWYFTSDLNGSSLTRDEGADSHRLSSEFAVNRPFISDFGEVYTFRASLRGDGYYVGNQTLDNGNEYNGFTGRVIPQASLEWRLPLMASSGDTQEFLTPIVMGVLAPNGMNSNKIPNEDSTDFEFDDTNLFLRNRFTGLDRVESGSHISYGVQWGTENPRFGSSEVLVGQSYRPHSNQEFANESGLEDDFSDYVGRVAWRPEGNLDFLYRFRIDKDELAARRSELDLSIGPAPFKLGANYLFLNQTSEGNENAEFGDREEITVRASSAISQYWSLLGYTRHDMTDDGGPIRSAMTARYEDECFLMDTEIAQDHTYDGDYTGGFSVMFRFEFKTLGEFSTGSSLSP